MCLNRALHVFVWMFAPLAILALGSGPLAGAVPCSPQASHVQPSSPTAPAPNARLDTTWRQTARLQVPLSEPRPAAVRDSILAIIENGGIDAARQHPADTTRRPVSTLLPEGTSEGAGAFSRATHLVLGYRFSITIEGFEERLRSVTILADSTEETCDRRYEALLHLDVTRDPVQSHFASTGVTVKKSASTRTYDSIIEAVRFAELYEEMIDATSHVLSIGGENACGEDLSETNSIFWNKVIIAR